MLSLEDYKRLKLVVMSKIPPGLSEIPTLDDIEAKSTEILNVYESYIATKKTILDMEISDCLSFSCCNNHLSQLKQELQRLSALLIRLTHTSDEIRAVKCAAEPPIETQIMFMLGRYPIKRSLQQLLMCELNKFTISSSISFPNVKPSLHHVLYLAIFYLETS